MSAENNADDRGASAAIGADLLIRLLEAGSAAWLEPMKIRRIAVAQAKASLLLTQAEIEREQLLADARYRLETTELRRQKNLEGIASILMQQSPDTRWAFPDEDWLAELVETAKDTAHPTLQDIWARLLAGELETPGRCSKRTLRLVRGLSVAEAQLIKAVCARVCHRVERDGHATAFLNVFVNRSELDIHEDLANTIPLYSEASPELRRRNDRLVACGFLSNDDFAFSVDGEGPLDPPRFQLSYLSPTKIVLGKKALVFDANQPGLLFKSRTVRQEQPHIHTPAASIEFDAWRLTPEGVELYYALNAAPDYSFLTTLQEALFEGGLAVTVIDV